VPLKNSSNFAEKGGEQPPRNLRPVRPPDLCAYPTKRRGPIVGLSARRWSPSGLTGFEVRSDGSVQLCQQGLPVQVTKRHQRRRLDRLDAGLCTAPYRDNRGCAGDEGFEFLDRE